MSTALGSGPRPRSGLVYGMKQQMTSVLADQITLCKAFSIHCYDVHCSYCMGMRTAYHTNRPSCSPFFKTFRQMKKEKQISPVRKNF